MKKITQKLKVDNLDELSKLLGAFDENLDIISRETGADISVFGEEIKVSGDIN